jgi:S1-C subfamily serine protease
MRRDRWTQPARPCAAGACAIVLAIGLFALAGGAKPAAAAAVVNCYDSERGTVQQKRAHACDGEAISDARARAVREARQQRRLRALRADGDAPSARRGGRTQVGSGFPVGDGRTIATARHVVTDCRSITVATTAGASTPARVVAEATMADVAVLRIDRALVPAIPVPTTRADVPAGTPVVAIGYPEQGLLRIRPASVSGSVLETARPDNGPPVIVFRGQVRRGNSGGPLVRNDGQLLGLVVAKVNTPAVFEATGDVVRDVAFAYPAAAVRDLLPASAMASSRASDGAGDGTDGMPLAMAEARTLRVICRRGSP